jgi:hypothetical protein
VMAPLTKLAEKIMHDNRHKLRNPSQWEPIYSFDKPTIHKGDMSNIGITEGQNTYPLPRYGGDFHKVIEHVHGTLTREMRKWQWRDRTRYTPAVYRAQLQHCFFNYKASSVQGDVKGLYDTARIVSEARCRGGTAGDWAPRPYN